MNIINNISRDGLSEGKNYQMGFGFLKQISENEFETVTAISACREYLNDVAYTENLDKPTNIYGLSYEKKGLLENDNCFMLSSILKRKNGKNYTEYSTYHLDLENFKTVSEKVQALLNNVEDFLGITNKTEVTKLEDNLIFIKFDKIWLSSSYLISLYSLLARVAQQYNNSDIFNYLTNYNDNYGDTYNAQALPRLIKRFKEKGFPQQRELVRANSIHSEGIMSYKF